jgi:cell division GTPase FtsZ
MTNAEKTLSRISTAADMLEELAVENEKLAGVFEKALSRAEAYRFAANWIRQILGEK